MPLTNSGATPTDRNLKEPLINRGDTHYPQNNLHQHLGSLCWHPLQTTWRETLLYVPMTHIQSRQPVFVQPFTPTSIRMDQSQPPLEAQVIAIITGTGSALCVNLKSRTVLLEKEHAQAHGGSFPCARMVPYPPGTMIL